MVNTNYSSMGTNLFTTTKTCRRIYITTRLVSVRAINQVSNMFPFTWLIIDGSGDGKPANTEKTGLIWRTMHSVASVPAWRLWTDNVNVVDAMFGVFSSNCSLKYVTLKMPRLMRLIDAPIGVRALRLQPHQPHGWSGPDGIRTSRRDKRKHSKTSSAGQFRSPTETFRMMRLSACSIYCH